MDIRLTNVLNKVKDNFGYCYEDLKSRSRDANLVKARHFAFYELRKNYGFTYDQIGYFFDRGHSNVYLALKKYVPEKQIINKDTKAFINSLEEERDKHYRLWSTFNKLIEQYENF